MKRLNLKLTLSLVSLFISIVLCAFSNFSIYCLFLGLIFMALASLMFSFYKREQVEEEIADIKEIIDTQADGYRYIHDYKAKKKEKKKLIFSFTGVAILLIIVAFLLV